MKKGVNAGAKHWNWRGGRKFAAAGYVLIYLPDHPRANKGCVLEHVLIAEAALGHALPLLAVVHHANEQKADNRNGNLAILQNQGEHSALHARLRIVQAGGNPWTQHLCGRCATVKAFDEFGKGSKWCRACNRIYWRARHGGVPRNQRHPGSKLTEDDVRAIRAAVAAGERQVDVARRLGSTKFIVNDIVKGRKYKSVAERAA